MPCHVLAARTSCHRGHCNALGGCQLPPGNRSHSGAVHTIRCARVRSAEHLVQLHLVRLYHGRLHGLGVSIPQREQLVTDEKGLVESVE